MGAKMFLTNEDIGIKYYSDLSSAITDINEGVNSNAVNSLDDAKIKVYVSDTGRTVVMLLSDLSESNAITVNKDIDLVLAGHILTFTKAKVCNLWFSEGTSCTINGEVEGSSIVMRDTTTDTSQMERLALIRTYGEQLTIVGGKYHMEVSTDVPTVVIVSNPPNKLLEVRDCYVEYANKLANYTQGITSATSVLSGQGEKLIADNVKVQASTISSIRGIYIRCPISYVKNCNISLLLRPICAMDLNDPKHPVTSAYHTNGIGVTGGYGIQCGYRSNKVYIEDSYILADAPGCNAATEHTTGIVGCVVSAIFAKNVEIHATHTGINSSGNLYVRDSLLSGTSHGGIYITRTSDYATAQSFGFAGTENEWNEFMENKQIFLKDTTLWSNHYIGAYNEAIVKAHGGVMGNCYIGNYYDDLDLGNDVYMDGCTFNNGFCVRMAKTKPNRLFISNSTIPDGALIRVQNDSTPAELKIGVSCNFTPEHVSTADGSPDCAEITNELYRRFYSGEALTAEDYNALLEFTTK